MRPGPPPFPEYTDKGGQKDLKVFAEIVGTELLGNLMKCISPSLQSDLPNQYPWGLPLLLWNLVEQVYSYHRNKDILLTERQIRF